MIDAGPHEASLPTDLEVEEVLAKYDGEPPTKPFLTPVSLHTNPQTGRQSFRNMVREEQESRIPTSLKNRKGFRESNIGSWVSEISYWKMVVRNWKSYLGNLITEI